MRSRVSSSQAIVMRLVMALTIAVAPVLTLAQTPVSPPKNKFTPEQDVQLGREAAAEAEKQLPLISDDHVVGYVNDLGERLVDVAPAELNHPAFQYSFKVVNQKEINAFALPGGPMFINRGMLEAADTEAEVVGVMAHELAHVLLRHGTANVTKAQKWQWGSLAGAIAGAIVGGDAGALIADGSQLGVGAMMMRYSRDYEKQADLLGVQMMARAGYDPMALARMFETIQRESGGGGPQWLSSHPNPGNRSAYIQQEASLVRVANPRENSRDFERVRSKFSGMAPAPSAAEIAGRARTGGEAPASVGRIGDPVQPPATQYRRVNGGKILTASVPANWQALSTNSSIKFVPKNGYGQVDGRAVFTHGVEMGIVRAGSRNLEASTASLVDGLHRSNPNLRVTGEQRALQLSGRSALGTPLVNVSEATGREERIALYTTFLSDGSLFYYVTIVPVEEYGVYRDAFTRVGQSIRLHDR